MSEISSASLVEILLIITWALRAVNSNARGDPREKVEKCPRAVRDLARGLSYRGGELDKYLSAGEERKTSLDRCRGALACIAMKNTLPQCFGTLGDFDCKYGTSYAEKACQQLWEKKSLPGALGRRILLGRKSMRRFPSSPEAPEVCGIVSPAACKLGLLMFS